MTKKSQTLGYFDIIHPPKEKKMYVLIGEFEGDYDDQYQRAREVECISHSKEALEALVEERKEENGYIEMFIEEVEEIE